MKVERRELLGATSRFEEALKNSEDSSTSNTSFIERLNLTIRQSFAYLTRRTLSHADYAETTFPHTSSDGRLVASSDRGGNRDVWILSTEGGEMRQLTTHPSTKRARGAAARRADHRLRVKRSEIGRLQGAGSARVPGSRRLAVLLELHRKHALGSRSRERARDPCRRSLGTARTAPPVTLATDGESLNFPWEGNEGTWVMDTLTENGV